MVHRFGDKYGVGDLAEQISQTGSGKLTVANASTKQKILDLRQDPAISACLAAEYAKQNQNEMEQALGRPLSRGDLYMAHFLGAGGATQFLKALDSKGDTAAAKLLPDAASANPSIFYDSSGRAKSVREIYQSVASKIEKDADAFAGGAPTSMASSNSPSKAFTVAPWPRRLGLGCRDGSGRWFGRGYFVSRPCGRFLRCKTVDADAPDAQRRRRGRAQNDRGQRRCSAVASAPAHPAPARVEHST